MIEYQVALVYVRVVAGWILSPLPTCTAAGLMEGVGAGRMVWGDVNGPRKPRCVCWLAASADRWGLAMPGCQAWLDPPALIDLMLCHLFLCPLGVKSPALASTSYRSARPVGGT